jgi:uncharacterized membrane protein YkvA (DUF1232 family)
VRPWYVEQTGLAKAGPVLIFGPRAYLRAMSLTAEDKLSVLQRFVDKFPEDLATVRAAVADASTPEAAQRYLIGGLNYALDKLDLFPDHHKGIGLADDAIVLRLAAKLAKASGAADPTIEALALDANNVFALFDDLAMPLEKLVAQMPDREVRGRTAAKIISHKDTRVMFDADVGREAKRLTPQPIPSKEGADRAIIELRKMLESGLKRAGVL